VAVLAGCGGADREAAVPDFGHPPPVGPLIHSSAAIDPPRCPPRPGNCATATGSVLAVEAVDPDGDGDAHLVLLSPEGITAPGITVIDVERELRPHPLPRAGDHVAAAGPVYRGSYGQRQIQATELRVSRADGD
jgi:hypothetical protein